MNLNVNKPVVIEEVIGNRTHHSCKPVFNRTTGEIYASATDAAEALNTSLHMVSACCRGVIGTCKGNVLEYVSGSNGNINSAAAEIRRLRAEIAALQADAAIGRAIREAEEAKRKEEEKHLAIIESARELVKKLTDKLSRRQRMVERKEADYMTAIDRYTETERELREAELKLLELEGKVKE